MLAILAFQSAAASFSAQPVSLSQQLFFASRVEVKIDDRSCKQRHAVLLWYQICNG